MRSTSDRKSTVTVKLTAKEAQWLCDLLRVTSNINKSEADQEVDNDRKASKLGIKFQADSLRDRIDSESY